jgi:hypothetical protein
VFGGTVLNDCLSNGGDVIVVECCGEGTSAMSGRAEGHPLSGYRRIGMERVVGGDQAGHIHKGIERGKMPGAIGLRRVHAMSF